MPNQAQIKDWVSKQKATGMSDADIQAVLVSKGVLNDQGKAETDAQGNVRAAPKEEPGLMRQAADVINKGYETYKNLPVVKQVSQGVGEVVGNVGEKIGNVVGAVGNPIANVIEGKPVFQGEAEAIKKTGESTRDFGRQIGTEGAAAAPLGGAGRALNLAVAYGQGYQGVSDLVEGYKEGDAAQMFEGALAAGTAAYGAKGAIKSKGFLISPEAKTELVKIAAPARKAAAQKMFIQTVDAYRKLMNMNKSDVLAESRSMKDTPRFLAEEGIIPKSEGMKFTPDKNIETLQERLDPLQEDLTNTFKENPKELDLDDLRQRAVNEINKDKSTPAIDREEMIGSIDEVINAEKRANGAKVNPDTGVLEGGNLVQSPEFNRMKSSFWKKGYNPQKTKVANSSVWQLGHEAKLMLEEAYKGEADIKAKNQKIGDYAAAIRLLDQGLRGKVVPGGRLGNLFMKLVGATAFSAGGPLASIVGAEALGRVSDFMGKPETKLGMYQKILSTLKDTDTSNPEVGPVLDKYTKQLEELRAQDQTMSPEGPQAPTVAPQPEVTPGAPSPDTAPVQSAPEAPIVEAPPEQGKPVEDLYTPKFHREVKPLPEGEKVSKQIASYNLRKAYTYAPEAKTLVDSIADSVAEQVDGTVSKVPLKNQVRSLEKVMNDYGGDVTRLSDIARNTIVVKNAKSLAEALKILEGDPTVKSIKEIKSNKDVLGYSGVNVKVQHPNGMLAEIQLNTPDMIYAKESPSNARKILGDEQYQAIQNKVGIEGGQGHKLYEDWRSIDRSDPTLYHKAQAAKARSKKYYSSVREAYESKPVRTAAKKTAGGAGRSERK